MECNNLTNFSGYNENDTTKETFWGYVFQIRCSWMCMCNNVWNKCSQKLTIYCCIFDVLNLGLIIGVCSSRLSSLKFSELEEPIEK